MVSFKTISIFLIIISCLIIPTTAYERYMPGSDVYLNETIDVSGMNGWADYLAYYGGWGQGEVADYLLKLPPLGKRCAFYIDPEIFANRTGYWYQWYGNNYDDNHGFTLAFKVVNGNRSAIKRYDNGTINFETDGDKGIVIKASPPVTPRHVTDYLVARGDNITIKTNGVARIYILGNNDGLYNIRTYNNSAYISEEFINSLRLGDYKVVIQYPGSDLEFNVLYNKDKKILSSLYSSMDNWSMKEYDTSGLTPMLFKDKLLDEIDKTNDGYSVYNLLVEDPSVDIISQDEVDVSKVKVLQVMGYTNTAEGTQICFWLDEKLKTKSMSYTPTCVVAQGTEEINEIGDMRYFVASVPFSYSDLSVGTHFITGKTSIGGSITTSFYVYESFDDQPRNSSLKYIAGNLFVPTPTPEIVKVIETQIVREVVTQVVEVQLTPDLQQLYETQKKVSDDKTTEYIVYGIIGVCVIIGIYFLSVLIRGMRRRE